MTDTRIPWWQPQLTGQETPLVLEVLSSNFLNDGEFTDRFEAELAKRLCCKHVVAVTSGTAALFAAMAGLGIGHGDEVIVPDMTFIATANAVSMTGAKCILVDIDPKTLTADLDAVRRAITSKTKAIIPVHISGRPGHLIEILDIAERHGLSVIEDAAEALLSRLDGKCLGTFGHAGCFSFSPMKTIQTGQGGAVTTDNDELYARLKELKDQGRPKRGTGGNDIHNSIGYNFKLTNLQAAIGLGQLAELNSRSERLKQIYAAYDAELAGVDSIELLGFDLDSGNSPQWIDALVDRRDELTAYLKDYGIDCRCFWHPIHTQRPYHAGDEHFPNSTMQSRRALWLPSAFTLTDDDIAKVCRHIKEFFSMGRTKNTSKNAAILGA